MSERPGPAPAAMPTDYRAHIEQRLGEAWDMPTPLDAVTTTTLLQHQEALLAEVARLSDALAQIGQARCLCEGHWSNPPHGGPCCTATCVTCQARTALEGDRD